MATLTGMTWAQIKEMALKRTDRRAEKTLDVDYELWSVIQDFCTEHEWYWRKLTALLTTTNANPLYDLSDADGANMVDCEKIIRVEYVKGQSVQGEVVPITDPCEISRILDNTDPGNPGGYLREPGNENFIRFDKLPPAGLKLRVLYWACPAQPSDQMQQTVPLVPARYHHILVKGLEVALLRYSIGEGATKYTAAKAEYDRLVSKAARNREGISGIIREYRSDEVMIQSS